MTPPAKIAAQMIRSLPFCWLSASPTPISAMSGETGHSGIRNGRSSSFWRTRLTTAEIAISAYRMMISTAVKVTTLIRLDCAHRIAPSTPTVIVATHGILNRGCT